MPAGYSLHIGVNKVDPKHYNNWEGILNCCENDALFYNEVAQKAGFLSRRILLSSGASAAEQPLSEIVNEHLEILSDKLSAGDFLFISYSGHGGQVEDLSFDETDWQDETWCLYDRQLIDDELWDHFSRFAKGVRILIVSDSCHSGSVTKAPKEEQVDQEKRWKKKYLTRDAPRDIGFAAYEAHKEDYVNAVRNSIIIKEEINATVLLMGACQDTEKAVEDEGYGMMTGAIRKYFMENERVGSYNNLHGRIFEQLSTIQRPNIFCYGQEAARFCEEEIFLLDPDKYFSFVRK